MEKAGRAYLAQFVGAMIAYVIVLTASVLTLRSYPDPDAAWRIPVALLPVVPAILLMMAFVRYMRGIDELQRQIQLEALALGFGGTAVLTFGYGFLQGVGLPLLNWTFVFPLMVGLWGIGVAIAGRRYQ
ncbi:MAG TPA: hypothetical protein VFG99_07530 [Chloroflexia bacterium]|nr:hypothetical protein [Chloroflexia bacterium]